MFSLQMNSFFQPMASAPPSTFHTVPLPPGKKDKVTLSDLVFNAYSSCRSFKEVQRVKETIEYAISGKSEKLFSDKTQLEASEPAQELLENLNGEYSAELTNLCHVSSPNSSLFHHQEALSNPLHEFLLFTTEILYADFLERFYKLPQFLDPKYSSRPSTSYEKNQVLANKEKIIDLLKLLKTNFHIREIRSDNIYIKRSRVSKYYHVFILDKNRSYLDEEVGTTSTGSLKLVKQNSFFVFLTEKQVKKILSFDQLYMIIEDVFIRQFISISRPNTNSFESVDKNPDLRKYPSILNRKGKNYSVYEIKSIEDDGFFPFFLLDSKNKRKMIHIAPFLGKDIIHSFMTKEIDIRNEKELKKYIASLFKVMITKFYEKNGFVFDVKLENILYHKCLKQFNLIDYKNKTLTLTYIFDLELLNALKYLGQKNKHLDEQAGKIILVKFVTDNRERIFYNNLVMSLMKVCKIHKIIDFDEFFRFLTKELVPRFMDRGGNYKSDFLLFLDHTKDIIEDYYYYGKML